MPHARSGGALAWPGFQCGIAMSRANMRLAGKPFVGSLLLLPQKIAPSA
jgi:hypothetical protein